MSNILNNSNKQNDYSEFKVIFADTELEIFAEAAKIKENFCFINLSSEYAVNFVLEYEKIDILFISKNISNFENIIERAKRKKIKTFIIEKDLPKKFDNKNLEKIILKEFNSRNNNEKQRIRRQGIFKKVIKPDKQIEDRDIKENMEDDKSVERKENESEKKSFKNNNFNIKNNKKDILKEHLANERKNKSENQYKDIEKVKTVKQKVITVFRSKGGVGTTTISYFIATLLNNIKTLIIDLNFNEGCSDLGYYLNTPKTPNLTLFSEGYDKNSFQNCLISINNNVDIILPPPSHEISNRIDLKEIYALVELARKKYDLMIFDLPNKINEFYLGITDISDTLLIISDESTGSLGRITEIVKKYIYDELKKVFVINKVKNPSNINTNIEIIKKYLDLDYFLLIPYLKELDNNQDLKKVYFENLEGFNDLKNTALKILTS